MAESAVSSVSKWIGKLVEEVKYLDQVTENMKELQGELQWMLCFLQDADHQRYRKAVVQEWVSQIKEHAYDAEDLVDKYMLKVTERTKDGSEKLISTKTLVRYLCIHRDVFTLHDVGSEMDALTLKISKLAKRLQRYGVQINKGMEDDHKQIRRTYAQDSTENFIIGIEDDVNLLVSELMKSEKKVIALIGMGGIGKTTMARQVYNHEDLKKHFVAFSWVHVSQKLDIHRIMSSILRDLVEDSKDRKRKARDQMNLRSDLYATMQRRNCLVVIDDVWSLSDFSELLAAFPNEADSTGSRVLLTSRNEVTIKGLDSLVYTHKPKGLKGDNIMKLFKAKFGKLPVDDDEKNKKEDDEKNKKEDDDDDEKNKKEDDDDDDDDDDGKKKKMKLLKDMLGHCGGNPLAISAIAAILKRKEKVEEWKVVRDNMGFYLKDPDQPYQNVYDVLGTSFSELPPQLKPCFLHLANFPEDYQINTDVLVKLWSAEGLITLPRSSLVNMNNLVSEEDIAHGYLNELEARSMIQAVEREESTGRIKIFQLHDLIRDVCMSTAADEGFLHQLKDIYVTGFPHVSESNLYKRKSNSPSDFLQVQARLRRLAVHEEYEIIPDMSEDLSSSPPESKVISAPGLRSLIFFHSSTSSGNIISFPCSLFTEDIYKSFPLLRVLEFAGCVGMKGDMSNKLGDLIHLRYLGLRDTQITNLPSSIANLKYLQTLDLRTKNPKLKLSNVLWKLKLLKHLYLPGMEGSLRGDLYTIEGGSKLRLDGLTHLEILTSINLNETNLRGLNTLVKLKSLVCFLTIGKFEDYLSILQSQTLEEVTLTINTRLLKEDSNRVLSQLKIHYLNVTRQAQDSIDLYILKLDTGMFPQCIASLFFTTVKFEEDPAPALGMLQNLDRLEFSQCIFNGVVSCSNGSFPNLTYLSFHIFTHLEWEVEQGALPRLQRIYMFQVKLATRLPQAIRPSVWVTCYPCVEGIENQDRLCPDAETLQLNLI